MCQFFLEKLVKKPKLGHMERERYFSCTLSPSPTLSSPVSFSLPVAATGSKRRRSSVAPDLAVWWQPESGGVAAAHAPRQRWIRRRGGARPLTTQIWRWGHRLEVRRGSNGAATTANVEMGPRSLAASSGTDPAVWQRPTPLEGEQRLAPHGNARIGGEAALAPWQHGSGGGATGWRCDADPTARRWLPAWRWGRAPRRRAVAWILMFVHVWLFIVDFYSCLIISDLIEMCCFSGNYWCVHGFEASFWDLGYDLELAWWLDFDSCMSQRRLPSGVINTTFWVSVGKTGTYGVFQSTPMTCSVVVPAQQVE